MTPPTPPTGVPTTSTPGRGAQNANGSHISVTHDPAGTLAAAFLCLAWVHDDQRLCHLAVGHAGSHLALPVPWPRADVTASNPKYRRTA